MNSVHQGNLTRTRAMVLVGGLLLALVFGVAQGSPAEAKTPSYTFKLKKLGCVAKLGAPHKISKNRIRATGSWKCKKSRNLGLRTAIRHVHPKHGVANYAYKAVSTSPKKSGKWSLTHTCRKGYPYTQLKPKTWHVAWIAGKQVMTPAVKIKCGLFV